MKGSVVPAHRRPGSATSAGRGTHGKGGGGRGVGSILQDGALDSTGALRDASPWAPQAAIRSRPASAGVRRTIADDAFALLGQNKAAAEIQASVRARPASAGLRGRAPGALATATGSRVEDYEPVKKLGQGASGSVHLVVLKEDGSRWVLKQVELGRGGSAPSSERNAAMARAERDNVLREVKLMSSIRSDNIVKYCTSFLHQAPGGMQSVCIVMEYAERGALGDYIKHIRSTARKAEESFIWRCMLQVAAGLAAIHAHRVIHRDIKSANILIMAGNDFKIADLGIAVSTSLANVQGRMRTGRCGTLAYMAPEVANDLPYDARADMWSLGCVLYEVACLRVPFPSGTCVDTRCVLPALVEAVGHLVVVIRSRRDRQASKNTYRQTDHASMTDYACMHGQSVCMSVCRHTRAWYVCLYVDIHAHADNPHAHVLSHPQRARGFRDFTVGDPGCS